MNKNILDNWKPNIFLLFISFIFLIIAEFNKPNPIYFLSYITMLMSIAFSKKVKTK